MAIVEAIDARGLDPLDLPAALVVSHGPFTWGAEVEDAVANAVALEAVAVLAERTTRSPARLLRARRGAAQPPLRSQARLESVLRSTVSPVAPQ